MTIQLEPIIITPEMIIAAAQKIVNFHEDAWEHTADEYLAATEHWLRCRINELLYNADFNATREGSEFSLSPKCQLPRCDEPALAYSAHCETHAYYRGEAESATELVMPAAPEWAHDAIDHAPAHNDAMLSATAEQMYGAQMAEDVSNDFYHDQKYQAWQE